MAKVVTGSQQMTTGVMYPRGVYSRSVMICASVAAPGVITYAYTPQLGNRLWLLNIQCWFFPKRVAVGDYMDFSFRWGTGRPASAADLGAWDNLLPVHRQDAVDDNIRQIQAGEHMSWDMNKFFEGRGMRFAIWMGFWGAAVEQRMYASFEISEG